MRLLEREVKNYVAVEGQDRLKSLPTGNSPSVPTESKLSQETATRIEIPSSRWIIDPLFCPDRNRQTPGRCFTHNWPESTQLAYEIMISYDTT